MLIHPSSFVISSPTYPAFAVHNIAITFRRNMANIHTPIPTLKLNDGTSIPMLSFGTGTALFKRTATATTLVPSLVENIKIAIKLGYHHIDTAEDYGTELEVGVAVKESGVDRSKLYITTKVYSSIKDIEGAIKASLKRLQLDYVDLYLIHAPFFADGGKDEEALRKAWGEMERIQEAGLARSIGVSNYLPAHFDAIIPTAKVVPAINQIEFHPYLQRRALLDYQAKHGIAASAFGPLTAVAKAKPGPVDDYLAGLAKKYAVSEGEVSLRYSIDKGIIAITTSSKEQRLSDYLRCTTFKLTPEEVSKLSELGAQKHFRGFQTKWFDADDTS